MASSYGNVTLITVLPQPQVSSPSAAPGGGNQSSKASAIGKSPTRRRSGQDAAQPNTPGEQRSTRDVRRADVKEPASDQSKAKKSEKRKEFADVLRTAEHVEAAVPQPAIEETAATADIPTLLGDSSVTAAPQDAPGEAVAEMPVVAEAADESAKQVTPEESVVVQPQAPPGEAAQVPAPKTNQPTPAPVSEPQAKVVVEDAAASTAPQKQVQTTTAVEASTPAVKAEVGQEKVEGDQPDAPVAGKPQPTVEAAPREQVDSAPPAEVRAVPQQPARRPQHGEAEPVSVAAANTAPRPPARTYDVQPVSAATEPASREAPGGAARGQGEIAAQLQAVQSSAASVPSPVSAEAPIASVSAPATGQPATAPGEQILEAVHTAAATGEQRLVIRLDPPELGQVRVVLHADGRQVRGVVQVEDARTLEQLRHETPSLISRLAEAGVEVRRMEMGFTNTGGDSTPQWQFRDGGAAGGGHGQGQQRGRDGGAGEGDAAEAPGVADEQQLHSPGTWDGAINVWI